MMRTWSIADALDDARAIVKYGAAMLLAPVVDWVLPVLGHDVDVPNEYEPALTDSELVAVRGLIQERYEDGESPKWLTDLIDATADWYADSWGLNRDAVRAALNDNTHCGHRYCERQGYGLCFGVRAAEIDMLEYPAATTETSAADCPAGVDSATPPACPPAGHPDPSSATRQTGYTPSVDGEGPGSDSDIRQSPEPGRPTSELLTAAIAAITDRPGWYMPHAMLIAELRDRAMLFRNIENDK